MLIDKKQVFEKKYILEKKLFLKSEFESNYFKNSFEKDEDLRLKTFIYILNNLGKILLQVY